MRGLSKALVALALAALALVACGAAELEGRATGLRAVIHGARESGAYQCAPRELALAESHATFAELELHEGDYYRARQELDVADENAKKAVRLSPKEKCNPNVTLADSRELLVKPTDADGDGVLDPVDACPNEPEDKDGFQDKDGCPDPDNDGDGVLDLADKCPQVAEDADAFQDEDGCPEDDNDQDGMLDRVDRCPDEAEDRDGYQDDDGCPDPDNDGDKVVDAVDKCPLEYAETPDGCPQKYQLIVVTAEKIELKQTIFFDYNRATIKSVSHALLDEVGQALVDNPQIRVRIEGHTDSRGPDRANLRLSQARAESVKKFLVGKGIVAARLEPRGFGETVPIADNRTQKGRDQNRRVEFMITSP